MVKKELCIKRTTSNSSDMSIGNPEIDIDAVSSLIAQIEEMAYLLAHAGERQTANAMFFAVTELEKTKSNLQNPS